MDVLWVILVGSGLLAALVGTALVRRSKRRARRVRARPEPRDVMTRSGREIVVERWLFLALELCRVDGAIEEREIGAIENALTDPVIGKDRQAAERTVHGALRATIREASVTIATEDILAESDLPHLQWVVRALEEVARADGEINDEEWAFLGRVGDALGEVGDSLRP